MGLGNPIMDGLDTALRIVSWNITGNETTMWDVIGTVASWFA